MAGAHLPWGCGGFPEGSVGLEKVPPARSLPALWVC